MLLQHREVVVALRQRNARHRSARRALWSGVAPQRAIVVALTGLVATATIAATGATAAARSGAPLTVRTARSASASNSTAPNSTASGSTAPATVEIGPAVQIRSVVTVLGSSREGEIGRAALAQLRIDWATLYPGWTIAFLPARSALLGMTLVTQRRVEVYVRADRSVAATAHDLAHELGHVTDVTYNDDAARLRFLAMRGLAQGTPWWTCSGCRDLQVPAGDFAETFALVAAPRYRFYSEVAPEPDAATLAGFVQNVLPAAVRNGFIGAPSPSAASSASTNV